jgi:hypothetical protein
MTSDNQSVEKDSRTARNITASPKAGVPGGLVASALSFAKAKVGGERYEGAENETVDLR